jgi:hypothetical protein
MLGVCGDTESSLHDYCVSCSIRMSCCDRMGRAWVSVVPVWAGEGESWRDTEIAFVRLCCEG